MDDKALVEQKTIPHSTENGLDTETLTTVNASGHKDSLRRQYGLLASLSAAIVIDNAWVAFGGSLVVAIANGGPAGVLYELLVACFCYMLIGASIAEFASSIPSAGGVYHWASVAAGPRYGRMLGFFTGLCNFFAWLLGLAGAVQIAALSAISMFSVWHADYILQPWHAYLAFVVIVWTCCLILIFANRWLPLLNQIGAFLAMMGGVVTIIVCVAMSQHASSSFVWTNYSENNVTGWSDGVAFMIGILNGAYAIGTPDGVTKLAEELPNPRRDLPRAVFTQVITGSIATFLYAVAILYSITDIGSVVASQFPVATIYLQATGSPAGAFGLLLILFLNIFLCCISAYTATSRAWWALARDNATPLASLFGMVNFRLSAPIPAITFVGLLCCGFGAIQLGSTTAANDLFGSFVILTTLSYALAIGAHLVTRRRNIPRGPFWMGSAGHAVNMLALLIILVLIVFFCFPATSVTTVSGMNYNSVILVGIALLTGVWWLVHGLTKYPSPKVLALHFEHPEAIVDTGDNGSKER